MRPWNWRIIASILGGTPNRLNMVHNKLSVNGLVCLGEIDEASVELGAMHSRKLVEPPDRKCHVVY